ncbi:outer membrane beta-barrel protein [Pontibacter indicus]|uniref:Outer membrane protein beta-barrel domain-containing protein n=1 Tax=Pontibacter indicus TaxID=1317125 RepID=A0A1R3XP36_9BACT|nr:outer membrane beta-barrel protein [Pontibacter indicus]SIT93709.1 Outer membrane protein beta-barrel domain-containing protein [Pontibacter indicus]
MKQLYITFLLTFLVITTASAQKDFRSGFIVQNTDTLRGYVDYRGAVRSSKITTFKANLGAPEQEFDPSQLAAYGFVKENKVYEAQAIPADTAQPAQRLFVQVLAKGKASVYAYRDGSDQDHFYLSKEGGELIELKQKVYNKKDPKTGKTFRMVDDLYLSVLRSSFYDCPAMTDERLRNVALRHNSLAKAANDYNECMGGSQYVQPSKKTSVKVSPVIVFSKPTLETSGEHPYSEVPFRNTGLGLGGGLALEVANPAISEKLSLVLELLYAPYRYEGEIKVNNLGRTTDYDLLLDLHYLKVPAQLRYTFPKGRVRPFVNAGASYSYAFSTDRVETKNSTFHNTSYTEVTEALPGSAFKQYMFGVQAGIGLLYPIGERTLHIETRYETTEGVSNVRTLSSSIAGLSVLAGYRF